MYKNRGVIDVFYRKLLNCNYFINDLIFIYKFLIICLIIMKCRVLYYKVLNVIVK